MVDFLNITITQEDTGRRIDRFLRGYFQDLSQGEIEKLLRSKMIRLDAQKAKSDTRIHAGNIIRYPDFLNKKQPKDSQVDITKFPQDIILYQDADLMVINKPWGLASQGGSNMKMHLDMLLETLPKRNGYRPSAVHRLDKDTSGCLLIAKKRSIAAKLGEALRNKEFEKYYLALTDNIPQIDTHQIQSYLFKSNNGDRDLVKSSPKKEIEKAQFAQSCYHTLSKNSEHNKAFILLTPITGRTHQLRVHCQDIKCPIIGDPKYNNLEHNNSKKLCLHAAKLIFTHPNTDKKIEVDAPLPQHFTKILNHYNLGLKNPISYDNKELLELTKHHSNYPHGSSKR